MNTPATTILCPCPRCASRGGKMTIEQAKTAKARLVSAMRKTHAGGRPRTSPRCPCGAMTVATAAYRKHICAAPEAPVKPKVYTRADWDEFIRARNTGAQVETDRDIYDYFLDVLPPVFLGRRLPMPDGRWQQADYGFAEGAEPVIAFWSEGDRYFCERTGVMNPHA